MTMRVKPSLRPMRKEVQRKTVTIARKMDKALMPQNFVLIHTGLQPGGKARFVKKPF